jgi:fructosamine-3-kinase
MNTDNYGYAFNNIKIHNGTVIKSAKNKYGKRKIQNEIEFYKYIISNNIQFPIPTIIDTDCNNAVFIMEYLRDHCIATKKIGNANIIQPIMNHLHRLHTHFVLDVSRETYIQQLHIETNKKIIDRYNDTDWNTIWKTNTITHVNNTAIHDVHYYIQKINLHIYSIIDSYSKYQFSLIHGDAHLGNILILDDDIRFIDPRGYFGDMKLYGIKEYDAAKLLFGLSGYSVFDEMTIENVNIQNGNIEIDFIDNYLQIYDSPLFSNYEKLLSLTIWLGNNSMFSSTIKKLYSLLIAYYICEKHLLVYDETSFPNNI